MTLGIYVHVPFCLKKCCYCDFLSAPPGPGEREDYVISLIREMELAAGECRGEWAMVDTVYLGGGTPSVLTGYQLVRILESLGNIFQLREPEITVEVNPGTLSAEKLAVLQGAGVNRLSMGVQSLEDVLLTKMGRVHKSEDVYRAVEQAREAGFANISLDLIYGLPGQTMDLWQATLEGILQLQPEHISLYALTIEEGTSWGEKFEKGTLPLPEEEDVCLMYELAREKLGTRGYQHYELSNFALPGRMSRHNIRYWLRRPYLGLGPGAASLLGEVRYSNTRSLATYHQLVASGILPRQEEETLTLTLKQQMSEWIFLGLRLLEGVDMEDFHNRFGLEIHDVYHPEITKLCQRGLLIKSGQRLKLSEKALLLANEVFVEFA